MNNSAQLKLTIRVSEQTAERHAICGFLADALRRLADEIEPMDFTSAEDQSPIEIRDEHGQRVGFAVVD
jgi:hypothetical protein